MVENILNRYPFIDMLLGEQNMEELAAAFIWSHRVPCRKTVEWSTCKLSRYLFSVVFQWFHAVMTSASFRQAGGTLRRRRAIIDGLT